MPIESTRALALHAALLALLLLVGCTARNERYCGDGVCIDPAFPFCDADGKIEGAPNTCIAVECTAGELVSCRGDQAITCNATGTNYDVASCELGCDAATNGCRQCEPNQTACTNGKVSTCDASGNVTASTICPLGCFADQPRCRAVDPSNNLSEYLDRVTDPPDLDLVNARFNITTGVVTHGSQGPVVSVPSFQVNGSAIRVFVADSVKLDGATFILVDGDPRSPPSSAFALVARGDIEIRGEILVPPRAAGSVTGCPQPGHGMTFESGSFVEGSGGGGGGNATEGAAGGSVLSTTAGGAGGATFGTPGLVPLRGGCAGGFSASAGEGTYHSGGGAIQLTSGGTLHIDGTIDARGGSEVDNFGIGYAVGGGGGGGGILMEAPKVTLGAYAKLLATGGRGAQGCVVPNTRCGAGGSGATEAAAASRGADVEHTISSGATNAGGGGGGLGRLRINTADTTYTKSSGAIEAAAVTTGMIRSR